jgi:hypothetical protein
MFEFAKRPLYAWATRRKNQQTIAALEADLRTSAPLLLVHQMGRAGSMTTTRSIRASPLAMPVYHTHWLHPKNLAKRLKKFEGVPEVQHPLNVRVGRRVSEELQREGPGRRKWKLVTVFREPVARNISVFFLSIDAFVPDFARRYAGGPLDNRTLLEIFLREFPHDQPLSWFDMEMGEMFGVDVYQTPFPQEQGYQVLKSQSVDLLLIKIEEFNSCYHDAFSEFLGVNVPELLQTHITERDPTRPMYADFVKNAVLPQEYLDDMYESRFARHFYTPDELAEFRKKWSTG